MVELAVTKKQLLNNPSWVLNMLRSLAGVIISSTMAFAGEITLAWDANTEPDLAGYNIYYGDASGTYPNTIDVKQAAVGCVSGGYDPFDLKCCEITLTGFEIGKTYYFAATAYDEDNNESAYSEELVHTFTNDVKLDIGKPKGITKK